MKRIQKEYHFIRFSNAVHGGDVKRKKFTHSPRLLRYPLCETHIFVYNSISHRLRVSAPTVTFCVLKRGRMADRSPPRDTLGCEIYCFGGGHCEWLPLECPFVFGLVELRPLPQPLLSRCYTIIFEGGRRTCGGLCCQSITLWR